MMITSVITVEVRCPKCGISYADRYIPVFAIPEVTGRGDDYADDCVVATCPSCDHMVSVVVRMSSAEKRECIAGGNPDL